MKNVVYNKLYIVDKKLFEKNKALEKMAGEIIGAYSQMLSTNNIYIHIYSHNSSIKSNIIYRFQFQKCRIEFKTFHPPGYRCVCSKYLFLDFSLHFLFEPFDYQNLTVPTKQ